MKRTLLFLLASFIITGCGGAGQNKKTINKTALIESNIDKQSKAQYGILSEATVKIYQLGEGDKKLLFTEKTSSGSTVDEIGNFNAHLDELDTKKFYLYEITGGENWDADKDGNLDNDPTQNKALYRTINRGSKNHLAWWNANTASGEGKRVPESGL